MEKNNISIPFAIIFAAIIIGGSVIYVWGNKNGGGMPTPSPMPTSQASIEKATPIGEKDYVLGSRDARAQLVVYTDLECPYCKTFHVSIDGLAKEYGDKIAIAYRHFPLTNLHPKAPTEAMAAECVGKIKGNDAYWQFVDSVFGITPSNNGLDLSLLPGLAKKVGVNEEDFSACMEEGSLMAEVEADFNEGMAVGVDGTPHSILITPQGRKQINGAQPYEALKSIIDQALSSN